MLQLGDLILHEGDKRGDDHSGALGVKHGGQLVAKGLASAGGHNDAGIAARGDAVDDIFLTGAKAFVSPVTVESIEIASGSLRGRVVFSDRVRRRSHGCLRVPAGEKVWCDGREQSSLK